MLTVVVNGEKREMQGGSTVADLVRNLGLETDHVAVERNRDVVPKAEHVATTLADGDHIEVVTFVGGG